MKVEKKDNRIYFRFEKADWALRGGDVVRQFIEEFKTRVDKRYRDYNELNGEWSVDVSGEDVLNAMREQYFPEDNRQMGLFGEEDGANND